MVAMLVDKILSACCGESELASKFPWNKSSKTEEEEIPESRGAAPIKIPKKGKFSDQDMKYELCTWKQLPLKVRRAAEDIGFDAAKWDGDEWVEVDGKHWHDLSDEEKKAVEVFGWDEAAWEHKYEHSNWADLPELQKKAATAAGFDQEKWDEDSWPSNLDKSWEELSLEDKQAMCVLGWTQAKWD